MKATGVVRRIDELGRVVIPKEIRRTLKIKTGTPLEIFCGDSGELIFKKYSPIVELGKIASEVAQSAFFGTQKNVFVTNMEGIIASAGTGASTYLGKSIDSQIEKTINDRQAKIVNCAGKQPLIFDSNIPSFAISPILNAGDVYGAVIIFDSHSMAQESDLKVAKSFADFLSKQIG